MTRIHGYHAHVYHATETQPVAERVRHALAERFHQRLSAAYSVEMGRFSGERIGPHPVPQFQIIFTKAQFQEVVPWMMLNREGLDILVHPLTDDMVDDHTIYALWLGKPVALVLDHMQRRGYRDALLPGSERKAA